MKKESDAEKEARLYDQLGKLYEQGRYEEAIDPATQLCELEQNTKGSKSGAYAQSLNNLGMLYYSMGDYQAAEPLLREALDITREAFGERSPDYARSLNNLGLLFRDMGDYKAAEPLYREALGIYRDIGELNPDYATTVNHLGSLLHDMGDYQAAEPLLREALDIRREVLGEQHPDYATSLNNLATFLMEMGDYQAAEPLYRKALDIRREVLGEQHPDYTRSLNNLGSLYRDMGNYHAAEPLLREALDIRREVLGELNPLYAQSLNNLAGLYAMVGDYKAAELLIRETLDITREVFGEEHPDYARSLHNLAGFYRVEGDYKTAEPLYRKACEIFGGTLGEWHPTYAMSLYSLATVLAATDRVAEAFELMTKTLSIEDHMISQIFSLGSERQRMAYLQSVRDSVYGFLSLVSRQCPPSHATTGVAMDVVLRRKAIGAEALATQRDAVLGGKYPDLRELLDQYRTLTSEIAQETFEGPSADKPHVDRQRLVTLNSQKEELEAELARQIPEMDLEQRLRAADYRRIADRLPKDTALVEFVCFCDYDFAAIPARSESVMRPPRYLAFVMCAQEPDDLAMIDLGEVEDIDRLVIEFRASMTHEDQERGMRPVERTETIEAGLPAGADLRKAVFDPLLPHLGGATRVFIAPDGELTRLPFEALPTDDGQRLIDVYGLSYLSVGRDVLRFAYGVPYEHSASVVIADPDYDLCSPATAHEQGATVSALGGKKSFPTANTASAGHDVVPAGLHLPVTRATGRRSRDLASAMVRIDRLTNTEAEGVEIGKFLKVAPWLRDDALEGRLEATTSPLILHVATHGFFLENQQHDAPKGAQPAAFADVMLGRIATSGTENPLLRSGLVLAGVNTYLAGGSLPPEAEDGVLTALDVSGMDLLATELAVLSACETGLGDIQTGEGVFGLRRAFMLAGAKTLVMSLWSVPDEATKELMVDFYRRILAGEGRADALR
ncbi:MAG: tetratricopeptide repeat protein, partial [Halobacteriota archaeon]